MPRMHETDDAILERYLVGEALSADEADRLAELIDDDASDAGDLCEEIQLARLLPVVRACPSLSPDHVAEKVCRTIELAEAMREREDEASLVTGCAAVTNGADLEGGRLLHLARFCQVAVTILGVMQAAFFGFLLVQGQGLYAMTDLFTLHTALFVTVLAVGINLCAEWVVYAEARVRLWLTGRWVAPTARAVLFARLQALGVMVVCAFLAFWQGGVGLFVGS